MKELSLLTKEKRKSCMDALITFFNDERNEELGIIAAEEILDFFLQEIGDDLYNKGLADAKTALKKLVDDVEVNLDALTRQ